MQKIEKREKVLVCGGAGYIGSHTVLALERAGFEAVIVDDLSNSKASVLDRLQQIAGRSFKFYRLDLCQPHETLELFRKESPAAVIHFAGYKAVGESVEKPLMYYRNNLDSTLSLLEAMQKTGCRRFVFSSSATVYGGVKRMPLREDDPTSCTSPYGWTKVMIEQILRDLCVADKAFSAVLLRYFNPIGADPSGLIGEDPQGIPNNLMPYITQVAIGKLEKLHVFGDDYPTPDGTGVRDYIHVSDLAEGHVAALDYSRRSPGCSAFNLGTGQGVSVLELVHAFEKASGQKIPLQIEGRRAGDIAECYADPSLAEKVLGWKACRGLEEMCRDSWNWQKNNPGGYPES